MLWFGQRLKHRVGGGIEVQLCQPSCWRTGQQALIVPIKQSQQHVSHPGHQRVVRRQAIARLQDSPFVNAQPVVDTQIGQISRGGIEMQPQQVLRIIPDRPLHPGANRDRYVLTRLLVELPQGQQHRRHVRIPAKSKRVAEIGALQPDPAEHQKQSPEREAQPAQS